MNKWDLKYQGESAQTEPCFILKQQAAFLPDSGNALDLACGLGGNAVYLAEHGFTVDAMDSSAVALQIIGEFATEKQLKINLIHRDVERGALLPANTYDVIAVSYFLFRPLFPALISTLKPGGLIYYQTFNRLRRDKGGPRSPDFLLEVSELAAQFKELETLFYSEDLFQQMDKPAISAGVFRKPS
ncbi:class I SAM-dependent methyltransferase [Spongiibacter sp. KMU-158]|uniref:Class I SAM-dependent methyltransferase n=1 Tax=Spongiibacter pelagi TaxID=2760804 RepID=A0A927C127_9GAMM|nr:class I SAM-dependent methyltransferase [Spongiibacter pelagi]MBD2857590.1 class I SAM-dependent methyltransferase [Spongiibacter pelagi]